MDDSKTVGTGASGLTLIGRLATNFSKKIAQPFIVIASSKNYSKNLDFIHWGFADRRSTPIFS